MNGTISPTGAPAPTAPEPGDWVGATGVVAAEPKGEPFKDAAAIDTLEHLAGRPGSAAGPVLPPGQAEQHRADLAAQMAKLEHLAAEGDLPDELVKAAFAAAQQAREGIRPTMLAVLNTAMNNVNWSQTPEQHHALIACLRQFADRLEADDGLLARINFLESELSNWNTPKPLNRGTWQRNGDGYSGLVILEATTRCYRVRWNTWSHNWSTLLKRGQEYTYYPDHDGWIHDTFADTRFEWMGMPGRPVIIHWNVLTGECAASSADGQPLGERLAFDMAEQALWTIFPGIRKSHLKLWL